MANILNYIVLISSTSFRLSIGDFKIFSLIILLTVSSQYAGGGDTSQPKMQANINQEEMSQ